MQLFGRQKIIVYLLGLMCTCVYGFISVDFSRLGRRSGGNVGYQKGGMGGQVNDGNAEYLKEMMDSGFDPSGFEGLNNHGAGFEMRVQDLGGNPKFGNNRYQKKFKSA